ncbi:MAG: CHAP domain-containing protein, partial [Oscillospiraceae bacterium]
SILIKGVIYRRTKEENKKLADLEGYYEVLLEMIKQVAEKYGIGLGLTMSDLDGVEWVNGNRNSGQFVIDLALLQEGQAGGQPYWSWYGFDSRVEWCATFVSWCLHNSGVTSVPKYASCESQGVNFFVEAGQWATGGFTDLVAGDIIFFDWQGNGYSDHTGLVIGTDGTNVYTIEGNSGDVVRVKSYSINSPVIKGYGLVNY